jgi:hypothetical protein
MYGLITAEWSKIMQETIHTKDKPLSLLITVNAPADTVISVIVKDSEQLNTVLTKRSIPVQAGTTTFEIPLPLAGTYTDVILINEASGTNDGFELVKIQKAELTTHHRLIDFNRWYHVNEFIAFIKRFCFNAGTLPVNDPINDKEYYRSSMWHFFIKYMTVITDFASGMAITMLTCICINSGLFEVAQSDFINYTVPERIAPMCHEYGHAFSNLNPNDESEADINGLMLYLGMGFSPEEAEVVWEKIFAQNNTNENADRMQLMKQYIADFKNGKV